MQANQTRHQVILGNLYYLFRKALEKENLGRVFIGPIQVQFDSENEAIPDLVFVTKASRHIVKEKRLNGAPDLVIEIISHDSVHRDTVHRKNMYKAFGVSEYWIVYPEERLVDVYYLESKIYRLKKTFRKRETLVSANFEAIQFKLDDIYAFEPFR